MVSVKRKAFGLIKKGKTFRMVFGSRTKPVIGSKVFKTRAALFAAANRDPRTGAIVKRVVKRTIKRKIKAKLRRDSGSFSAKRLLG